MKIKKQLRSKRGIVSLVFIVILLALFFGGGTYLGLFSAVATEHRMSDAYTVVGLDYYGSFRKTYAILDRDALPELQTQQNALPSVPGVEGALIDDRYIKKPRRERHYIVGYIYPGLLEVDVEPPLKVVQIPARDVLVADLHAHRTVAAFKAYRSLREGWADWLEQNQQSWGSPSLELFHDSDHLEVQMPLEPN